VTSFFGIKGRFVFFLKTTRRICTNFFQGLEENNTCSLQPALKNNALGLLAWNKKTVLFQCSSNSDFSVVYGWQNKTIIRKEILKEQLLNVCIPLKDNVSSPTYRSKNHNRITVCIASENI